MNQEKRRPHSRDLKREAVKRMKAGENISKLAREMKVGRSLLYAWKAAAEAATEFQQSEREGAEVETDLTEVDKAARITELERLVGQLTLENRFFSGALQKIAELRGPKCGNGKVASLPRFKQ